MTPANQEAVDPPFGSYTEPISEGEEDEVMDVGPVKDEAQHMKLPSAQVSEAIKHREEALKRERESKQKEKAPGNGADNDEDDARHPYLRRRSSAAMAARPENLAIDPLAPASQFDKSFWSKLNGVQRKIQEEEGRTNGQTPKKSLRHTTIAEDAEEEDEAAVADDERGDDQDDEDENGAILVQSFHAQPGKRIAVPVRIEPKVMFANERTFMVRSIPHSMVSLSRYNDPTHLQCFPAFPRPFQKWLHFSVIVGTVATTLLNFLSPEDGVGLISAFAFTFAALLCIAYSGAIYAYRAYSLRHRIAEGWYYDPYGPTVLCIILGLSIAVNLILRTRETITGHNILLFSGSSVSPSQRIF
jgi:hypothetical protein